MSAATAQYVVGAGLALGAVVAARAWRLGLERQLLIAGLRAAVQLLAVGAIIAVVFREPRLSVPFVAVMLTTATLVAGGRLRPVPGARRIAAAAIAAPALGALGLLLLSGAFEPEPRAVVPGAGILIGGAMAAVGLTGRRFLEALADRGAEVEARLCLGDDARTALRPLALSAMGTALVPVMDQTRTAGLVTLPGTFVGLVLGGASPAEAARLQLLVLLALLAVQLCAARAASALAVRACTLPGDRVREL